MTNETFLYIGITGLVLSILNVLRPHIWAAYIKAHKALQQTPYYIRLQGSIQTNILAQGISPSKLAQSQSLYTRMFWIISLAIIYFAIFFQSFMMLCGLPVYPYYLLTKAKQGKRKRNQSIAKNFPYFLDIFILCLESGLDSTRAIKEISAAQTDSPLQEELRWIMQSVQIGQTLPASMTRTAHRTQSSEFFTLAQSLTQASELGTSLSSVLRVQSQNMREVIFTHAQAQAQKAPVKMLFPLIFCIFPVVFIILFIPIAVHLFTLM